MTISPHQRDFASLDQVVKTCIRRALNVASAAFKLAARDVTVAPPTEPESGFRGWARGTYEASVHAALTLQAGSTTSQHGLLFYVPWITRRGTFLLDGREHVPILQVLPVPGVAFRSYVSPETLMRVVRADIIPEDGSRIRVKAVAPAFDGAIRPMEVTIGFLDIEDLPPGGATGRPRKHRTRRADRVLADYERWRRSFEACRFGAEGRRRLNERVQRILGGTHGETEPHLVKEDLDAVVACAERLAIDDGTFFGALTDDPGDLGNLRVLTIADIIRHRLTAALTRAVTFVDECVSTRRGAQALPVIASFARAAMAHDFEIENVRGTRFRVLTAFGNARLMQPLDETNPLAEVSHIRKVTRGGPGGVNAEQGAWPFRDLHPTHEGILCPLETPESGHIGINLHLVREASLDRDAASVARLNRGTTYELLGWSASLIPFLRHDDATRAVIGAKNMKQAVPLVHPEAPLVKTGLEGPLAEASGAVLRSSHDGEVIEATPGRIRLEVTDRWGATVTPEYSFTALHPSDAHVPAGLELTVRARLDGASADSVKKGDILARHPATTSDGKLALGTNLLVAYLPFRGLNFEDGIVASERLVRDDVLTSRHLVRATHEVDGDYVLLPSDPDGSTRPPSLDARGVVQIGTAVGEGDELARLYEPRARYRMESVKEPPPEEPRGDEDGADHAVGDGLISYRGERWTYRRHVFRANIGEAGRVAEVVCHPHGIEVWIESRHPLAVGDKLMGRHGNKGVVTAILPVEEMPWIEGAGPADLVLNPVGALTRMNIGQLLETHVGWLVKRGSKGLDTLGAFAAVDPADLSRRLAASGLDSTGKARVRLGKEGQYAERPVVVGWQYFMKLNHLAGEKHAARGVGPTYDPVARQPVGGRKAHGGQRWGEMERWTLEAWGADAVATELLAGRADDVKGRDALEDVLQGALAAIFEAREPEAARVRLLALAGLHIRVRAFTTKGTGASHRHQEVDPYDPAAPFEVGAYCHRQTELLTDEAVLELAGKGRPSGTALSKKAAAALAGAFRPHVTRPETFGSGRCLELDCGHEIRYVTRFAPRGEHRRRQATAACPEDGSRHVRSERAALVAVPGGLYDEGIWGQPGTEDAWRRAFGVIELRARVPHPLTGAPMRHLLVVPAFLRAAGQRPRRPDALPRESLDRRYLSVLRTVVWLQEALERVGGLVDPSRLPKSARPRTKLADRRLSGAAGALRDAAVALHGALVSQDDKLRPSDILDIAVRVEEQASRSILRGATVGFGKRDLESILGLARSYLKLCETVRRVMVKSLVPLLGGKDGFLRRSLLGKRVEVSGRAVIVSDPTLDLDACGLPFDLAAPILRHWITPSIAESIDDAKTLIERLLSKEVLSSDDQLESWLQKHGMTPKGLAHSIGTKPAKLRVILRRQGTNARTEDKETRRRILRRIRRAIPDPARLAGILIMDASRVPSTPVETWLRAHRIDPDRLAASVERRLGDGVPEGPLGVFATEMCRRVLDRAPRPVILSRPPSLHRYSAQAFRPTLRADHVISIPPAVCGRFNADFDGDQMAAYPILGGAAAAEADRMRPSESLKSTAAGQPLIHVAQEMRAGLVCLALEDPNRDLKQSWAPRPSFPRSLGSVSQYPDEVVRRAVGYDFGDPGFKDDVNQLVRVALDAATEAGLSVSYLDIVALARELASSGGDIDAWLEQELTKAQPASLALLAASGALRSLDAARAILKALALERGSFDRISGGPPVGPVTGNLCQGLSTGEVFVTAYGARKSLADKKLITPVSGFLTRQLYYATRGFVVGAEDCGCIEGIPACTLREAGVLSARLHLDAWARGRVLVNGEEASLCERDLPDPTLLRSPVTCGLRKDGKVCSRCYGRDPQTWQLPRVGTRVGVIAATSIGERGTQLALRTFHTGGVAGLHVITSGLPRVMALLEGRQVHVPSQLVGPDAWEKVSASGEGFHHPTPGRLRRLSDLPVGGGLVRVFLYEMYGAYKPADLDPKHLEVVLAALIGKDEKTGDEHTMGLTRAAGSRLDSMDALAYRDAGAWLKRLAKASMTPSLAPATETIV